MFHRRPFGNVGFHCQLPFTMISSGMLFFLIWLRMFSFWHPFLVVSYNMFLFVYVRFGFHECGGFSFCFSIGCCCLFPFSSVCFRLFVSLRSCAGLHRLLLFGSESQSHLWEFHAEGQVVTNRWRIHRLWF